MNNRVNFYKDLSADYSRPDLVPEEIKKILIEDAQRYIDMKEANLPEIGQDYTLEQIEKENKEWWPTHCEALRQGRSDILTAEYHENLVYFCQDGPYYGLEEQQTREKHWWALIAQPGVTMCWPIVMFNGEFVHFEWQCLDTETNETIAKGSCLVARRGHRGAWYFKSEQLTFYRDVFAPQELLNLIDQSNDNGGTNRVKKLDGKVILVTGGGFGIGRESCLALAEEGAKVVVADINLAGGQETVDLIRKAGGEALFVKADISREDDVKAMVEAVVRTYGRLDCAYNNAGIEGELGVNLEDITEESFDRLIKINVKGPWLCMKYEIPQMLKQGHGVIVNTASVLGTVACPGFSSYVASKHAIVGLTRAAALENAKRNIRINAICPAAVRTQMLDRASGVDWDSFQPMGRAGTPEEVAKGVVFLFSDDSSFMTGHTLLLDGGISAG